MLISDVIKMMDKYPVPMDGLFYSSENIVPKLVYVIPSMTHLHVVFDDGSDRISVPAHMEFDSDNVHGSIDISESTNIILLVPLLGLYGREN